MTRWKEPHLPAYLFLGELSGALATVGALAHATGRRSLARTARLGSAVAAYGGGAFLTAELGRPERFLNMLRVAKPTSPMSMGSWLLAATRAWSRPRPPARSPGCCRGSGRWRARPPRSPGPLLAAYPGVLLADTAVPAWHSSYRELPMLFAGGAMTAAGAAGLAASAVQADRSDFDAARRLAIIGAAVESAAGYGLEVKPGPEGEPYRIGAGARMLTAARYLTLGGGVAALAARRSRVAALASAALLAGGGYCAKAGVLRAGKQSAADPRYVVASQLSGARRG